MKLWIKIGAPIVVLTIFATALFVLFGYPWVALGSLLVGLGTIVATKRALAPLEDVTAIIEGIAEGNLEHDPIEEKKNAELVRLGRTDEIGRLARSTNQMISQLSSLSETAEELAAGNIGVVDVEEKVLETGRLSDADVDFGSNDGDLERSFTRLTNQMRRLTIQARIIARDDLYNPLLDEKIPGDLGDSFGLMVRNLRTIADRAKDIAEGDLTSYVEGEGELTTAFNQMVTGLNDLIQRIVQTALHISSASEEILVVLQDQELAASHQASGVEETQRTMETLLASARKIADNSQTVFKSAEKTQANNRTVANRIGELKSHTARITEILEVIKSIADRSDLLALNASLEGMRAGEAGKGFTLVAAEMRRLAENIKESIGDIKELVSDIRESSLATVMATEEGSRLSEQTTDTALQISLITQQQQSGTEQVTQSMEELSHLINQGVAGTRQVTTAASELADASDTLRTLVDEFEVADDADIDESTASQPISRNYERPSPPTKTSGDRESAFSSNLSSSSGSAGDRDEFGFDDESELPQALRDAADGGFDPRATLTRSRQFAEKARQSDPEPTMDTESQQDLESALDADADDNKDPSSSALNNEDFDDQGLNTPTVEFSSAMSAADGLFDDVEPEADSQDSPRTPDSSGGFEAIARDIESTEIDTQALDEDSETDEEESNTK